MRKLGLRTLIGVLLIIAVWSPVQAAERWQGTDEVIEGIARQYGAQPRDPLVNTDQGDLPLFIFAAGGLVAGAIIGYNWRRFFVEREGAEPREQRS